MRFHYSTPDPNLRETDSLPRLPLVLRYRQKTIEAIGLVDSGATVNVMPFDIGLRLGAVWDERQAVIRLSGSLGSSPAMTFFAMAQVAQMPAVRLAFAWIRSNSAPLILGQINFFAEFNVCCYRSTLEFEISPR
jgi:hypothetical protein